MDKKIFVAPSYENCEILGEPFLNDKGKLYVKIRIPCKRCGGSGSYSYCSRYGTMCLRCAGTGVESDYVRAYTEKEYNQLIAAKTRREQKKAEEKETALRDCLENANKYKHEIALKLGFNEDEKAYVVVGGNTFTIKEQLKEMGGRFNSGMKWYLTNPQPLPEGFSLCEVSFDEVYEYHPIIKEASLKDNAAEVIQNKLNEGKTEYYDANEGERIRDISATLKEVHGFSSHFGYSYIYTFVQGNYTFVWMTTKNLNLKNGSAVSITGTIKKFDKYNGIKQTHLSRCVVTFKS